MDDMAAPQKVKPKHLDCPLVAGCSVGHKSCILYMWGWDMDQTKQKVSNDLFLKDGFCRSYHTIC